MELQKRFCLVMSYKRMGCLVSASERRFNVNFLRVRVLSIIKAQYNIGGSDSWGSQNYIRRKF